MTTMRWWGRAVLGVMVAVGMPTVRAHGWGGGADPGIPSKAPPGCPTAPLRDANDPAAKAAGAAWTSVWCDPFDQTSGRPPNPNDWTVDLGHHYPNGPDDWGTHEIESFDAAPDVLAQDGRGHLAITPRRDSNGRWRSARIETKAAFRPPLGGALWIEARVRMPNVSGPAAAGYWPAFWALGADFRRTGRWPASGEWDLAESVDGLNSVYGILHCGVLENGPCHEPNGLGGGWSCPNTSCGAFHVYALEWNMSVTPQVFRWYVDGQMTWQVRQNQLPAAEWAHLTRRGVFLIFDVAIGGGFPWVMNNFKPVPNADTEPNHPMLIDYVAVWQHTHAQGPIAARTNHQEPTQAP